MAPQGILRAIDSQAAAKASELEREAEERAADILREAEERAQREADRFVAERVEREERATARKLHSAEIAKNRAVADVRSQIFGQLFEQAKSELSTLRSTAGYPAMLAALIEDAARELAKPCVVRVDPADADVAQEAVKLAGLDAEIKPDFSTIGGAVVVSCDGRTANDNTFEARLARIREDCARDIWEVLES